MTGPGQTEPRSPNAGRPAVLSVIAEHVRVRFELSAEAFADRVLEVIARTGGGAQAMEAGLHGPSLDDLYLATACARGEEQAWKECSERYFAFIRNFARRYLPGAEAADLADGVIAELWQRDKIGRYEGRSRLRTWLGAVVAHAALNALKARRATVDPEAEELRSWRRHHSESVSPDAAAESGGSTLAQLASEALASLGNEDKLLLLLYYEQGLTLDQIGVAVRASKTALSRRLKRVREQLREAMEAIARRRWGTSAEALRQGVDLSRVELDLERLLGGSAERPRPDAV